MKITAFAEAPILNLVSVWNGFYPTEFRIDADLLRLKTVDSPTFDPLASGVVWEGGSISGFLCAKRSPTPLLYPGARKDQAHINSLVWRDIDAATELLDYARIQMGKAGVKSVVFGQDSGHFFPGCPKSAPVLREWLEHAGFRPHGEMFDVARDLAGYQRPRASSADAEFRLLADSDLIDLDRFLSREFSPRWRYDAMRKADIEGPQAISGMFVAGELSGFALLQNWTHREPIGGGVWRAALGERWGSLGPIGVAAKMRGAGLGSALLGASLERLRDFGVRKCIIDWTGIVDFYAKHGFRIIHSYQGMSLDLT